MNKKQKKNRYKKPVRDRKRTAPVFGLKALLFGGGLLLLSLSAIFVHDFIVQCDFFGIEKIVVTGNSKVDDDEIIQRSRLERGKNSLAFNRFSAEKRVLRHPWIRTVSIKRDLPSVIVITVSEQSSLAVVKIADIADIVINRAGLPFKEVTQGVRNTANLPVITGIALEKDGSGYRFRGELFDMALEVLETARFGRIDHLNANRSTGITITTSDFLRHFANCVNETVQLKLGFGSFVEKAHLAALIAEYFNTKITDRKIGAFDLYKTEKIFIRTVKKEALPNIIKGEA